LRKGDMAEDDVSIKLYHRQGKKRCLKAKCTYEHERIYVPIPSKFHDKIKHLLNHELNLNLSDDDNGVLIALHPAKTLRHAEKTPQKS